MSTQATFFGYNAPFIGGPQNYLSRQEDDRLIKNDILQLLLTVPGDRIYRPDFGVNLRNIIFEPLDENTLTTLDLEIRDKLAKYEPRVILQNLELIPDEVRHGLQIKIIVYVKKDPLRQLVIEQFISNPQVA